MRDQILAACAAQLLVGKVFDLNAFIPSIETHEHYGGPCPKTPFDMNRRFLAMARFNADPEPAIRVQAMRMARREGLNLDNSLAAHGSTDTAVRAAAHHEPAGVAASKALTPSSAQSARPLILWSRRQAASRRTNGERGQTRARGPLEPSKKPIHSASHSPARPHPLAQRPQQA